MTGSGERLEAAKATTRDGPAWPPNLTRALHKSNDGSAAYNRWAQGRPEGGGIDRLPRQRPILAGQSGTETSSAAAAPRPGQL